MLFTEFAIIAFLSVFQSIFGIGLLLFGTPLFLYLGYSFVETLSLLLPVSISISAIQFFLSKNIDYQFVKNINLLCVPFVILFLAFTIIFSRHIDVKYWVSILLVVSSLTILQKRRFIQFFRYFIKYEKALLIFIGSIHGVTNMGGSFLSLFSSIKSRDDKYLARQYISYGYLSMGICQYTIVVLLNQGTFSFEKIYYVLLPAFVYFPSQKIFNFIIYDVYVTILGFLAFVFGIFMVISSYL